MVSDLIVSTHIDIIRYLLWLIQIHSKIRNSLGEGGGKQHQSWSFAMTNYGEMWKLTTDYGHDNYCYVCFVVSYLCDVNIL